MSGGLIVVFGTSVAAGLLLFDFFGVMEWFHIHNLEQLWTKKSVNNATRLFFFLDIRPGTAVLAQWETVGYMLRSARVRSSLFAFFFSSSSVFVYFLFFSFLFFSFLFKRE
jgi:hypothetical protein